MSSDLLDRFNDNNKITIDENILKEGYGNNFTITKNILGKGAYGTVYLAYDENKKKYAVKCCNIEKSGIPKLLEASIMSSYKHEGLNGAIGIYCGDKCIYMIQNLAKSDLSKRTRISGRGEGYNPTQEEIVKWISTICAGIEVLHENKIIHADIKASNILLYDDNNVKVTDYTLATKKCYETQKFTKTVCTSTHRPLECILKDGWDESLDIWSLGCTFYELVYGKSLFPYQEYIESNLVIENKKDLIEQRMINAILDWGDFTNQVLPTHFKSLRKDIQYEKLKPDHNIKHNKYFYDLLVNTLQIDPRKRLTIGQVLNHKFLGSQVKYFYIKIERPKIEVLQYAQDRAIRYIQSFSNNKYVQNLALEIFLRLDILCSDKTKSATCTWIAHKVIFGKAPQKFSFPFSEVLQFERKICHELNFLFC